MVLLLSLQSICHPLQVAIADAKVEDIYVCGCAGLAEQSGGGKLSS